MGNFRNTMQGAGYDQEEAYFFEREKELIEKARKLALISKARVIQTQAMLAPKLEEYAQPPAPEADPGWDKKTA